MSAAGTGEGGWIVRILSDAGAATAVGAEKEATRNRSGRSSVEGDFNGNPCAHAQGHVGRWTRGGAGAKGSGGRAGAEARHTKENEAFKRVGVDALHLRNA